jgi:hypothetical protein
MNAPSSLCGGGTHRLGAFVAPGWRQVACA